MLKPLLIAGALVMTMAAVYAQNVPTATCKGCPASYISNEELQAYLKRAIARNQIDQQVRSVDVGKSGVAVGMVHRTKLDKPQPNSVAEHDHVSEVYHVISGSATLVTGPDLVDAQRRPATNENVRLLNGPGSNAASIRNGVTHQLKAGDAIIIPAGTGHWFTKIDDHISYIMIRIDPDKVVPLEGRSGVEGLPLGAVDVGARRRQRSGRIRSSASLAPAAWAWCGWPKTRGSIARSRSRPSRRADADTTEGRQRLMREARAAAALNHPHIATVHDVLDVEGKVIVVFEYVEGETLSARLQRGPMSVAEAVEVAWQLADALAAAHSQGMIHRDLKPSNVVLGPDGARQGARLRHRAAGARRRRHVRRACRARSAAAWSARPAMPRPNNTCRATSTAAPISTRSA